MSVMSFPSFRPVAVLVIAFQFLVVAGLQAHRDPGGDVHPRVRVEDGNFTIYFRSKIARSKEGNLERSTFRMVYSPAGKLLVPREAVTGSDVKRDWTTGENCLATTTSPSRRPMKSYDSRDICGNLAGNRILQSRAKVLPGNTVCRGRAD
jgi:hypothetical protein